jgi:hypothetical protein
MGESSKLSSPDNNPGKSLSNATRHPLIGWMKGTVSIPDGVDLTEPACPEWADLIEQSMPRLNRSGGD